MDNSGYIKLHRKFLEWEWYDDINCKVLFIHCLIKANYRDKQWRGKTIQRGQFFTSIDNLADELHLSPQQIRTSLSKLETTKEIVKKSTNEGTYITICNYDNYQQLNQTDQQTDNKPITNDQQTDNKRITTTKKDKKEKKEKKTTIKAIPTIQEVRDFFDANGYDPDFGETRWHYYNDNDWHDSHGNQVLSWKQKMRSVWFKPENEKKGLKVAM